MRPKSMALSFSPLEKLVMDRMGNQDPNDSPRFSAGNATAAEICDVAKNAQPNMLDEPDWVGDGGDLQSIGDFSLDDNISNCGDEVAWLTAGASEDNHTRLVTGSAVPTWSSANQAFQFQPARFSPTLAPAQSREIQRNLLSSLSQSDPMTGQFDGVALASSPQSRKLDDARFRRATPHAFTAEPRKNAGRELKSPGTSLRKGRKLTKGPPHSMRSPPRTTRGYPNKKWGGRQGRNGRQERRCSSPISCWEPYHNTSSWTWTGLDHPVVITPVTAHDAAEQIGGETIVDLTTTRRTHKKPPASYGSPDSREKRVLRHRASSFTIKYRYFLTKKSSAQAFLARHCNDDREMRLDTIALLPTPPGREVTL